MEGTKRRPLKLWRADFVLYSKRKCLTLNFYNHQSTDEAGPGIGKIKINKTVIIPFPILVQWRRPQSACHKYFYLPLSYFCLSLVSLRAWFRLKVCYWRPTEWRPSRKRKHQLLDRIITSDNGTENGTFKFEWTKLLRCQHPTFFNYSRVANILTKVCQVYALH